MLPGLTPTFHPLGPRVHGRLLGAPEVYLSWAFGEKAAALRVLLLSVSSPGAAADRAGRLPQDSRPGEPEQHSRGEEEWPGRAPPVLYQEQQ